MYIKYCADHDFDWSSNITLNSFVKGISDKTEVEISNELIFNVIISFWDSSNVLLCLGALFEPKKVLTNSDCAESLKPFNQISVISGSRYFKNNSAVLTLEDIEPLHANSKYYLVRVSNST